jgi:hypothetical protein
MKWWAKLCAALGLVPVDELNAAKKRALSEAGAANEYARKYTRECDLVHSRDLLLAAKEQEIVDLNGRLEAQRPSANGLPFCVKCQQTFRRHDKRHYLTGLHDVCPTAPEAQEVASDAQETATV